MSFFEKVKAGLTKTASGIGSVFSGFSTLDDAFYDELEERLIQSDLGAERSIRVISELRTAVKREHLKTAEEAKHVLRTILLSMLDVPAEIKAASARPTVLLVIGVNGVGKTTTIGKLAARMRAEGKRVLLCAGDTFRAAAADQLEIWATRAGAELIRQKEGSDPASVVYDAISAAKARGSDIIICDTAGRLHNKVNLMHELEKIARIVDRELPDAPKEVLLVLDAATGQNGLIQAKEFAKTAGVTGMVLTKLDGTAKGGIVIAVSQELQIPVRYIGVGEGIDDLMPFCAEDFVSALI